MMNHLAALFMLASVVGCASAPASAPATVPSRASPVAAAPGTDLFARIPTEIGAFKLTERAAVTSEPTDSLFRFRDGSPAILTVFVYDVGADVKTDADPQKWTASEGEKFKEVQDIRVRRGAISSYAVAFSDTARFAVGAHNILEHSIAVPVRFPNGTIAVDMQYLYLIAGKFVKVRATIPETGWQQTKVPGFARELARRLAGGA
jgi:hypothetical protein